MRLHTATSRLLFIPFFKDSTAFVEYLLADAKLIPRFVSSWLEPIALSCIHERP